jgi:hypothetical protein
MSGYIGTQPVPQATQTRDSFTATSGQTSFATGGYTPNFLDVYLNGVKLASADYTASNGSDVVLASGAATGDILEVVAYTAFDTANVTGATNFTVTGAFTSQGIDDNGNATALTIDSNENVMLGTTTSTLYNVSSGTGFSYRNGVALDIARQNTSSAEPLLNLNLTGVDGSHILFYKDGTTVGSVGVTSGSFGVGQGDTGLGFFATDNIVFPSTAVGATRDNGIDLGYAGGRFKDAYLSGGVYLGGTGSANKLDDYEEGTWTATINGQTTAPSSPQTTTAYYTKVGNMVTVFMRFSNKNTTGASGNLMITGLPFSCSAVGAENQAAVPMVHNLPVTEKYMTGYISNGSTTIHFINNKDNTSWTTAQISSNTGVYLNMNITYQTTS